MHNLASFLFRPFSHFDNDVSFLIFLSIYLFGSTKTGTDSTDFGCTIGEQGSIDLFSTLDLYLFPPQLHPSPLQLKERPER